MGRRAKTGCFNQQHQKNMIRVKVKKKKYTENVRRKNSSRSSKVRNEQTHAALAQTSDRKGAAFNTYKLLTYSN